MWNSDSRMTPAQLLVANTPTGHKGLIALDKVGCAVLWFDAQSFEPMGRLALENPHQMSISPDRRLAVVSEFGLFREGRNVAPGRHLSLVSIQDQRCVGRIDLGANAGPHGSRWDANGCLWVVCEETGTLLGVDVEAETVTATIQVATPDERAHLVEMLPGGYTLYVACKKGPVKVVDLQRGAVVAAIDVGSGSGTEGIACINGGSAIVAASNERQDLVVIDSATNTVTDRVALLGAVMSSPRRSRLVTLQASPDGRFLLSSNGVGGTVHIHETHDLRDQKLVLVAKGPQGMAVAGDGKRFVVANHDAGVATEIALTAPQAGQCLRWFEAGKGVEALAFH
jgi:hypothetical protein